MSVGKNIRYHRKRRGITQKELGRRVGFPVASADVRIAQYENDRRCPKEPLLRAMAAALGVSPATLRAPDFDDPVALMNTLLSLEERFPVTVLQEGSVTRIQLEIPSMGITQLHCLLLSWRNMRRKLASGNLSREEYEEWKYSLI